MAIIIQHPKNKNSISKSHNFSYKNYEKYKRLYITFMFLFTSSFLTNVFLLLILGHYLMMR